MTKQIFRNEHQRTLLHHVSSTSGLKIDGNGSHCRFRILTSIYFPSMLRLIHDGNNLFAAALAYRIKDLVVKEVV